MFFLPFMIYTRLEKGGETQKKPFVSVIYRDERLGSLTRYHSEFTPAGMHSTDTGRIGNASRILLMITVRLPAPPTEWFSERLQGEFGFLRGCFAPSNSSLIA